jgi:undecaprenyl-diphosphatase
MQRWDRELEQWVVEHRFGVLDPLAQGLSHAGRVSLVWLVLALALALVRRRAVVFLAVASSAALASLLSHALKDATNRERPDVPTLLPQPDTHAFPSGHASTSFACATVLGAFAPSFRVPLYVLAALIAWSRVYVGAHWPLDVLAGALLGIGVGLAVVAAARALRALPPRGAGRLRSRPAPPPG